MLYGVASQDLAKRNDYTLAAGEKMSSLILSADSIVEEQLIDELFKLVLGGDLAYVIEYFEL